MSEMYIYAPKLSLFTFYCNARGFVLINKLFIYLFYNFCHNKANILHYIISYYMLHPIIYNTCYFYYILKYSMFTFVFPPFLPFVCQTRPDIYWGIYKHFRHFKVGRIDDIIFLSNYTLVSFCSMIRKQ